jgi:hypothetical protein
MNVCVLITVALLILLRNFEPLWDNMYDYMFATLDFPVFLDGQVSSEMSKMSYRYNDNQLGVPAHNRRPNCRNVMSIRYVKLSTVFIN